MTYKITDEIVTLITDLARADGQIKSWTDRRDKLKMWIL